MAIHSSILAGEIPRGDPVDRGAWQAPWGDKRIGHDLATKHTHTNKEFS